MRETGDYGCSMSSIPTYFTVQPAGMMVPQVVFQLEASLIVEFSQISPSDATPAHQVVPSETKTLSFSFSIQFVPSILMWFNLLQPQNILW